MNEYSTRYSEAIDSQQTTPPDQWRLRSKNNKQGSAGFVTEWPHKEVSEWMTASLTAGEYLSRREAELHDLTRRVNEERLSLGVARDQARKDLPLSTHTEA